MLPFFTIFMLYDDTPQTTRFSKTSLGADANRCIVTDVVGGVRAVWDLYL